MRSFSLLVLASLGAASAFLTPLARPGTMARQSMQVSRRRRFGCHALSPCCREDLN